MSFLKELFSRYTLHEGQSKSAELAYFFSIVTVSVFDFYADAHRVSSAFYR